MHISLAGKRAIVSASTAGIGLAIARGLAGAGADVVVNGRSATRVDAAVASLSAAYPDVRITGMVSDLAGAHGVETLIGQVPAADILVNNLGIIDFRPFSELADADWTRLFETNVMSGVRLSRHYVPHMVDAGWGRIVFISSEAGLSTPPGMISYGATKTAQLAVSRGLAEAVAGSGVTVNAVVPGFTRSESVARMVDDIAAKTGQTPAQIEAGLIKSRPGQLIGRLATAEEVANMVVYVCSEQASATTGAALRVDGGSVRSVT